MLKRRIRAFAVTGITIVAAAAALTGTGAVAQATPDAYLVLEANHACALFAPAHNVQVYIDCSTHPPLETEHNIRGFDGFKDPRTGIKRTAYELEITSGPAAGLCLNDDPNGSDSVSADSCQPTGADANEYFWVDNTPIANTHWYRNVAATDDHGGGEYYYLTDTEACFVGGAGYGDFVWDSPPGCGGWAEWTAITS